MSSEVGKFLPPFPTEHLDLPLPATPRVQRILDGASRVASDLGHNFIGVEHIVLCLIDEGKSLPAELLKSLGVLEDLERQLKAKVQAPSYLGQESNEVVDRAGNLVGHMELDDDGNPIIRPINDA